MEDLRGERLDSIVCLNVLEHIEDDRTTLQNFASVLSPGGHLVLLVPALEALYGTLDPYTFDIAKAIQEIKAGKVEFRVDKTSIIHVPVGKIQFTADQLRDNTSALISAVRKAKPPAAKGKYVRTIYISSTMSPSIQLDSTIAEAKEER